MRFLYKVLIVFSVFLVLVFVFSGIYHAYEDFFIIYDTTRQRLSYDEALWLSMSTQSLLGQGDVSPTRVGPRVWMGIQTALTFATILFIAATGMEGVFPHEANK